KIAGSSPGRTAMWCSARAGTHRGQAGLQALRSATAGNDGLILSGWSGHCAEILVQATQQVDQDFSFVLIQAGQQSPFALECRDNDLVVRGAAARGQRDRM